MLRLSCISGSLTRRTSHSAVHYRALRRLTTAAASTEPSTERRGSFAVDKHDAFRELGLKDANHKTIGRVRQHVNPLSLPYRSPAEAPHWDHIFENPELPLIIDAGTGYGRFALLAAKNDATPSNYLGTEIRRPLVGRANLWAHELGLSGRVQFLFANITISLSTLLAGYPGPVQGIYIQFPDPSFKKKTIKRHIVQEAFVQDCSKVLEPHGVVFMQSDVESCAIYMRNMFDVYSHHQFIPHPLHSWQPHEEDLLMEQKMKWEGLTWLDENPLGYPTEREVYSQAQGLKIYRTMIVKQS